jgi:hypothetical protein
MSNKRLYRAILSAKAYTELRVKAGSASEAMAKAEDLKYGVDYDIFDHIVEQAFVDDLEDSVECGDGPLEISHPEMGVDSGGVEGCMAQQLRN